MGTSRMEYSMFCADIPLALFNISGLPWKSFALLTGRAVFELKYYGKCFLFFLHMLDSFCQNFLHSALVIFLFLQIEFMLEGPHSCLHYTDQSVCHFKLSSFCAFFNYAN
ncbi:hypothetical protein ACJX0J_023536 [Zea mays]